MVTTITEVLNLWNDLGVFSYVIPFLLIFAVVYAILERSGILSVRSGNGPSDYQHNRPIMAIVAASIGLLSLQFDFVSVFFATIFPRFGIGLSIFLVLLIFVGFFFGSHDKKGDPNKGLAGIGIIVGIGIVIWSLSSYDAWTSFGGFGGWFAEYVWAIIILGIIIALILAMAGKPRSSGGGGGGPKPPSS